MLIDLQMHLSLFDSSEELVHVASSVTDMVRHDQRDHLLAECLLFAAFAVFVLRACMTGILCIVSGFDNFTSCKNIDALLRFGFGVPPSQLFKAIFRFV